MGLIKLLHWSRSKAARDSMLYFLYQSSVIWGGKIADSSSLPAELQRLLSTMRELDERSQSTPLSLSLSDDWNM